MKVTKTNKINRVLNLTNCHKFKPVRKTETILQLTRSLLVCRMEISSVID